MEIEPPKHTHNINLPGNSTRNKSTYMNKILSVFGYTPESPENLELENQISHRLWVPDDKATTCYNCQKQFSALFLRKHHCRICGNVFCKDCSKQTVDGKYWGFKKEVKVCDYCFEMYKKFDETLVETTIENNFIEDFDSIDDNINNLKRETKLSEYCKKAKKESEDAFKFLSHKDKKYEECLKQNLDMYYDQLVKLFIESVLKNESQSLYEKWNDRIVDLTKKAISQVNPSFKDLNDTLNINDYIKIKRIAYKDQSLSRVIDGYALQKNVSCKKMNMMIEYPKILLLDCGLDYCRHVECRTDFDNLLIQEPEYMKIIKRKIELVEPQLILVNKNVARKLQEEFSRTNKISLAMNVKSDALKKIARCTKTYVLPSTDLIDKQTILGTCKKFRVEKIKLNSNEYLRTNEYNLMIFEGCDHLLHCTIILSGDPNELKILKKLMREAILLTVRDLYLQKFFLYFFYCEIPRFGESEINLPACRASETSSKESSSTVTINANNLGELLSPNSYIIPTSPILAASLKKLNSGPRGDEEYVTFLKDFKYGFDTSHLIDTSNKISSLGVVSLTISQGNPLILGGIEKAPQDKIGFIGPECLDLTGNDLAESEVLKMINSICHEPYDLDLKFYSADFNNDKPLGKLIIDLCAESESKCQGCKKSKANHIYYMWRKSGRLKIQMILNPNEDSVDKVMEYINREGSTDFSKYNNFAKNENSEPGNINYNIDIFSYGYCKLCQKVVTPLVKLPREIFNFSVARLFKHMLFNHDVKNRSDKKEYNLVTLVNFITSNECSHSAFKDISRIFVTKMGSIKFTYETCPKYIIESSLLNERRDVRQCNRLLEFYITNAHQKCINVIDCLGLSLSMCFEQVEKLEKEYENIMLSYFITAKEKIKALIGKSMSSLHDILAFSGNLFSIPPKFEDYVKAIIYIKQVYLRIVQVKVILNNILRLIQKIQNYLLVFNKHLNIAMTNQTLHVETDTCMCDKDRSIQKITEVIFGDNANESNEFNLNGNLLWKNYQNIEANPDYQSILKDISFYDEHHKIYSSFINLDDFSSIIAYTLTSDKYREFISQNTRFKLIDIKCDRNGAKNHLEPHNVKANLSLVINPNEGGGNMNLNNMATQLGNQSNADNNQENKFTLFNFFTSGDEELYDNAIWFDQTKNYYSYPNHDTNKISQQLEAELLSDEKIHFKYTPASLNTQLLTSPFPIDFIVKKKNDPVSVSSKFVYPSSLSVINPSIDQHIGCECQSTNRLHPIIESLPSTDEKLILQGGDVKKTLEEIEQIKNEVKDTKQRFYTAYDVKTHYRFQKLKFVEDHINTPECEIIVYYPRQFEALRITYCTTYDEFILSIAKSAIWANVTGGKSKAGFYRSYDNKFILKCVNKHEFKMFLEMGFQYFHHNAKFLFHKMPSALAKILGAYKIKTRNMKLNRLENYYVLLMENLFYGLDYGEHTRNIKAYDLKGSKLNRYITKKNQKPNQVLPDTNFKEDFKGEPIALERNIEGLLKLAVHNDSLFLSKMNVIDYSLLLIIEDCGKSDTSSSSSESKTIGNQQQVGNIRALRMGIIDYVRKYTWDKQLEHVGKKLINRLQAPTIINPNNYKERFIEAMDDYFIGL